jgi:leucyl aminopeptidase
MSSRLKLILSSAVSKGYKVVALGVYAGSVKGPEPLTPELRRQVLKLIRSAAWTGVRGQVEMVADPTAPDRRVVLYGLGKESNFDAERLCRWLRQVYRDVARGANPKVAVLLPDHGILADSSCALRALTDLSLVDYVFDEFMAEQSTRRRITISVVPPAQTLKAFRRGLKLTSALVEGIRWSRDLANTPPNTATPEWLARQARDLAKSRQMKIRILGPTQLKRMKMGGMLAVGQGSSNPPRLVRLEWGRGKTTISLVGKGVTFDTGGISIKPARSMDEMKYDKCGACAVLGIARATSKMNLPFRFRAYLPLAENMPDGAAYRPGDIIRCYDGKTVEITNTDAEGRMILADALAWAAQEAPDRLLELSTLTGATVVALGHHAAALYTPSQRLATELLTASEGSGERLWQMPLWDVFGDEMKGLHADLRNTGARWGGANGAAAFLSNFVGDLENWAHLDIAGTAYRSRSSKGESGATGYGVALTVSWLLRMAGKI